MPCRKKLILKNKKNNVFIYWSKGGSFVFWDNNKLIAKENFFLSKSKFELWI